MSDEVMCPKCGGRTWDNRATKKNPKAPDFKCRDRTCDGCVWPPKEGQRTQSAPQRSTAVVQNFGGYSETGRDLILDEQTQHETQAVKAIQQGASYAERMGNLSKMYNDCLTIASKHIPKACEEAGVPLTAEALVAATATLLIAADKRGIAA
jgi:hypothetical protein